jgi:hypothetical protein
LSYFDIDVPIKIIVFEHVTLCVFVEVQGRFTGTRRRHRITENASLPSEYPENPKSPFYFILFYFLFENIV